MKQKTYKIKILKRELKKVDKSGRHCSQLLPLITGMKSNKDGGIDIEFTVSWVFKDTSWLDKY